MIEAQKKQRNSLKKAGLFNRIKSMQLSHLIIFCAGLFSTMPIVCIKVAGSYISLFTIFFALTIVILGLQLLKGKSKRIGSGIKIFLLWLALSVFSSAVGWLYFKNYPEWRAGALSYLPKVILYFAFAVLWSKQKNSSVFIRCIFCGMIVGSVLNLCWSIIDAVGYYTAGISVNNLVFKQYAIDTDTRYGTVSLIINGMIRAPGFNNDPAHIGFLAPCVMAYAIYKKNGWLILLSVLSIFSSASTTALVGVSVVMLLNIRRLIGMLNAKRTVILCTMIVGFGIVLLVSPQIRTLLQDVVDKFFGRISTTYGKVDQGGERSVYWFGFFDAVKTAGIMILFGTGFGTASYAYVFNPETLAQLGNIYYYPYDMEMTYISYFFDLGIVGFAVFIVMLYILLKHVRAEKEGKMIRALCIGMVLAMLFYHFTLMATQILVTVAGLTYVDNIKQEKRVALWKKRNNINMNMRGMKHAAR